MLKEPTDSPSPSPAASAGDSTTPTQTSPISRRVFVRAGSGMLLAATADACVSEGVRTQLGALRVLLTGLQSTATSGGSVRILHPDGRQLVSFDVPVIGDITVPAPIGEYTFVYEPPTGYRLLSDQTGPRAVAVDLDSTTTVAVSVVQEISVGAIQVNVAGLTGSLGGTAVATRTDAAEQPRVIPVSAAGSGNSATIPVGTYNVAYTPPPTFVDTSAVNPVTGLSVATGATATVAFTVAVAPGVLRIVVTGLAGATAGGQVSARRSDNTGNTFTLDLSEPVSGQTAGDIASVPAGVYTVTFTPPGGFQLAASSLSPQIASVGAGGTATVNFVAEQIPGSLQISVSGLAGATTGGTVTATRIDDGSVFPVGLPAPVSGTSTGALTGLRPGNYNASYAPPFGFQLASQSPQGVTIVSGGATPVAFAAIAANGTLRLIVEGVTGGANAGSAQLLRTDIPGQTPTTVTIPLSGSVDTALSAGTYSITYSPPSGYGLTTGQANPRSATVVGTQTTFATFQVAATPTAGTLRISATGHAPSAPNGGSAQVLRTDIANQSPLTVNVPTSGTIDTTLQPGTYSVTYTPPGGHRLVAGTANPQSIAITASGLGTVSFQNEVIPPAVGIIFHSDWSTATGTSDAARRDTNKALPWRNYAGNAPSGIETAASLGLANWPTPNAYVVRTSQAAMGSMWSQLDIDTGLPAPGSHRYFRVYVALLWEDNHGDGIGSSGVEHGIEGADLGYNEGGGGGDGYNPMMLSRANGTWNISYREISTGARFTALNIALQKFTTYRLEWHIAYGTGTYTLEIQLFDANNNRVVNTTDFTRTNPFPQGPPLTDAVFSLASFQDHRWLRVGSNGPTSNYPDQNVDIGDAFRAHGAVAVSDTNWVGPYAGGI